MMDSDLHDSEAPKVEKKIFCCNGKLWRTSREKIAHGVWAKSSAIE
jgi:hypothetical protein